MLKSEAIQQELNRLIGLPTWGANFAGDMLMLQFGDKHQTTTKRGKTVEVGDYALHIQVRWRLAESSLIHVGAADMLYQEEETNSEYILELVSNCLKSSPKVVAVTNIFAGSFSLELEGGLRLDIFPSASAASDDEFWRLFRPAWESPHFVVSSTGIE